MSSDECREIRCYWHLHVQPEDGHYQAPKHVVVPYVENTLYSTNKYSSVRPVQTLYSSYFIEHNGDDESHDHKINMYGTMLCILLVLCRE